MSLLGQRERRVCRMRLLMLLVSAVSIGNGLRWGDGDPVTDGWLRGCWSMLQPSFAQWSYGGPAVGCTDVLDVYTNSVRSDTTTGSTTLITISNVAWFNLRGPGCYLRGALTIGIDVSGMRAVALNLGNVSNVSITVGPGVFFEALLDTAAVRSDWPLRLPRIELLLASNIPPPFNPDALPVDISMAAVTATLAATTFTTNNSGTQGWSLVSLRNGHHIPRGSRIAISNTTVAVKGCDIDSTLRILTFTISLLSTAPGSPLVLLDRSILTIDSAKVALLDTRVVQLSLRLFILNSGNNCPISLHNASQITITGSTVAAVNGSVVGSGTSLYGGVLSNTLSSPLTLNTASALVIDNTNVTAVRCCGGDMTLSLLYFFTDCPITLHDASRLVATRSAVTAVDGNSSTSMFIYLIHAGTTSAISLHNTSQIALDSSTVTATNTTTSSSLYLYLLSSTSSSPLTLHDASQITATDSTVAAVNCSCPTMLSLYILLLSASSPIFTHGSSVMSLAGTTLTAVGCATLSMTLHFIHVANGSPLTQYNASQLVVASGSVTAVGCRLSSSLVLRLVNVVNTCPVTLHDTSTFTVENSSVTAVNCTSGSIQPYLIQTQMNSPLTLHNASRLAIGSSTVRAVSCLCNNALNVYLLSCPVNLHENAQLTVHSATVVTAVNSSTQIAVLAGIISGFDNISLADSAGMLLDGLALRAERVTARNSLSVVVVWINAGSAALALDMHDRSRVVITRSTADVTMSNMIAGPPLVGILGVPRSVLRRNSTVRLCASTVLVLDSTVSGSYYTGQYTDSPGTVGQVFGPVQPLSECNATTAGSAPCGLYVVSSMRFCLQNPTRTATRTVTTAITTATFNRSDARNETITSTQALTTSPTPSPSAVPLYTGTATRSTRTHTNTVPPRATTSHTVAGGSGSMRQLSGSPTTRPTRSHLITATALPAPQQLPQPLQEQHPAVEAAQAVSGAVGSVGVVSTVAAILSTTGAIVRISQCDDDDDGSDGLSLLVHPLQFVVGEGPARFLRGAIVGNTLVIPACAAVTFGVLLPLVLLIIVQRRRTTAFARLRQQGPPQDTAAIDALEGTGLSMRALAMTVVVPSSSASCRWSRGMVQELRREMGWPSVLVVPQIALAEGTAMAVTQLFGAAAADEGAAAVIPSALLGLAALLLVIVWWTNALARIVPSRDVRLRPATRIGSMMWRLWPRRWRHVDDPHEGTASEGSWRWALLVPAFAYSLSAPQTDDSGEGPVLAVPMLSDTNPPGSAAATATPTTPPILTADLNRRRADLEARHEHMIGGKALRWAELGGYACALGVGMAEGLPVSLCQARVTIAFVLIVLQGLLGMTTMTSFENLAIGTLSFTSFVTAGAAVMNVFGDSNTDRDLLRRSATAVGTLGLLALSVALLRPVITMRRMLRAADAFIEAELCRIPATLPIPAREVRHAATLSLQYLPRPHAPDRQPPPTLAAPAAMAVTATGGVRREDDGNPEAGARPPRGRSNPGAEVQQRDDDNRRSENEGVASSQPRLSLSSSSSLPPPPPIISAWNSSTTAKLLAILEADDVARCRGSAMVKPERDFAFIEAALRRHPGEAPPQQ